MFRRYIAAALVVVGAGCAAKANAAFFTQVFTDRLGVGMDGRGIDVTFNINNANNLKAAKIKDRNGNVMASDLAQNGLTWTLAGNLMKINVIADPPPPPFDPKSYADFFFQYALNDAPKKTGMWRSGTNAPLGAITFAGDISKITAKTFQTVAITLENDQAVAMTFNNIQLFFNQSLSNYDIDDFTAVTGTPVTLNPVTVAANSTMDVTFSLPTPLDLNTYVFATVNEFIDPSDVYGFGEADSVADLVPEPATILILGTACIALIGCNLLGGPHTRIFGQPRLGS
jgi:hypothetical protein